MDNEAEFWAWRRKQAAVRIIGGLVGVVAIVAVTIWVYSGFRDVEPRESEEKGVAAAAPIMIMTDQARPTGVVRLPPTQAEAIALPASLDRFHSDFFIREESTTAVEIEGRAVLSHNFWKSDAPCAQVFVNNDGMIVGIRATIFPENLNSKMGDKDDRKIFNLVGEKVLQRYLGTTWKDDLMPAIPAPGAAGARSAATYDYRGHWVDAARQIIAPGKEAWILTIRSKGEWRR